MDFRNCYPPAATLTNFAAKARSRIRKLTPAAAPSGLRAFQLKPAGSLHGQPFHRAINGAKRDGAPYRGRRQKSRAAFSLSSAARQFVFHKSVPEPSLIITARRLIANISRTIVSVFRRNSAVSQKQRIIPVFMQYKLSDCRFMPDF